MSPSEIEAIVCSVLAKLSCGEFDDVACCTDGRSKSSGEMRQAIADYGDPLVIPPTGWQEHLDIVPIRDANPRAWSIVTPCWTSKESPSDLSLELTITAAHGTAPNVCIENIHVR